MPLRHPPNLLSLLRLYLPTQPHLHPSPNLHRLLTAQSPNSHLQSHSKDDETPNPHPSSQSKDEYFAAIEHISNIVHRDFYLEWTLCKLPITVTFDLVYRVLRASSNAPIPSFHFFAWARMHL